MKTQKPIVKPNHSRKGFTLIEMLVVIAIIGLLTSILVPVVSKALTRARRTQSMSNLRQLFTAVQMYQVDHNGRFPNAWIAENPDGSREQSSWAHQLVDGDYLGDPDRGKWKIPMSYSVMGSPVQRKLAPQATTRLNPPSYRTYGMNHPLSSLPPGQDLSVSTDQLISPTNTMLISEGHLSQNSPQFGITVSPWGSTPNNTGGIVTLLYTDGHVGQIPDEEFPTQLGSKGSDSWIFWKGVN